MLLACNYSHIMLSIIDSSLAVYVEITGGICRFKLAYYSYTTLMV